MAVKKRATKKRAAKKKVAVVNRQADMVAKLRENLKAAKEETRSANKKVKEGERQVKALLKLLEKTQADSAKFLASRVKDAIKQYGVVVAPKRRKRRVAKKKVAPKSQPAS